MTGTSDVATEIDRPAITERIFLARGRPVILDSDLAELYGTTTRALNQQVKRNMARFAEAFAFQLADGETAALLSRKVTAKPGRGGRRTNPWVFTEHGIAMAATVVRTPRAVETVKLVVDVFMAVRTQMLSSAGSPTAPERKSRNAGKRAGLLDRIVDFANEILDAEIDPAQGATVRSELRKLPPAGFRYVQSKLDAPSVRNEKEAAEAEKLRAESRKIDAETLSIRIVALRDLIEVYRLMDSTDVAPLLTAMDALRPNAPSDRKLIDITPQMPGEKN